MAPAVKGKWRCQMHGGAEGSGAPNGNSNLLDQSFGPDACLRSIPPEARVDEKDMHGNSRGGLDPIIFSEVLPEANLGAPAAQFVCESSNS